MKLTIHNYAAILGTQVILILIDLGINTFIGYCKRYPIYQLVLYM